MAARPPRPPGNVISSPEAPDSYKCLPKQGSDCSCTNISIMQLFHEMKQEFPTVPDHVVNQCVIDNCHDRENCIKNLQQELITHPNTAQAYPSHVLRGNQNLMCNNKPIKPIRPAPPPKINCDQKNLVNSKSVKINETPRNNLCATQNLSDMRPQSNASDNKPSLPPQRPTTLNFREPQQNATSSFNDHQRVVSRPVRTAPLPPIIRHPPPNVQNFDQSLSSGSVQSPLSYSDSGESEISVNISVSPSSERSRGPPTRRISSISIQPEPPYSRDFTPQSPRSFTSLNLTLRKPSATPQSPIDITAGPGLTYSSSSFDARRGYQKNFHITVTDQGGVFSASRIRPRSCYNVPVQHPEEEFSDLQQGNHLRTASSVQNMNQDFGTTLERTTQFSYQQVGSEIVQRQKQRKLQLARALEQNKKRLEQVRQEIKILTSPINPDESERLDSIIERLRSECQEMSNKIEDAKRSGLLGAFDANEALYPGSSYINYENPQRQRYPRPTPLYASEYNMQSDIPSAAGQIPTSSQVGDDYSNTNSADGGPPWICSMCTFRNHPLLNKCECCDYIRIIPGTIRIVPSNSSSRLFSRLSSDSHSINNNDSSNNSLHVNSAEPNLVAYPAVMTSLSHPNPNFIMPGNG